MKDEREDHRKQIPLVVRMPPWIALAGVTAAYLTGCATTLNNEELLTHQRYEQRRQAEFENKNWLYKKLWELPLYEFKKK